MATRIIRIIARVNVGGPAVHTILLTEALNSRGFESVLVTGVVSPAEGDMEYYARQLNVTPVVVPALGNAVGFGSDFRALLALWRLISAERPDIIHTHTTKAGALGRVAGLLYNVGARLRGRQPARLVHTFHGHVFHGYFPRVISAALVLGERVLGWFTDRILVVSDSVARDLTEHYRVCRPEKLTVVPLGFDFEWVQGLADQGGLLRREFGIPEKSVVVGMVGRLTRVKNHALMLTVLARLRRSDVSLVVFGDGGLRRSLEDMARELALERSTVFAGWERDPARMYADVDIVCLTSHNEGTPVVLIEAMAAGLPFVATRVGGVPDLAVGDGMTHPRGFEVFANGILVPAGDADAFAAALEYLVERPEIRRAMGAVGQAAVLKRFTKERLVHDIETLYRTLLQSRSGEV
jgi:glycosyltransferase involved in cell wall biosynthesis